MGFYKKSFITYKKSWNKKYERGILCINIFKLLVKKIILISQELISIFICKMLSNPLREHMKLHWASWELGHMGSLQKQGAKRKHPRLFNISRVYPKLIRNILEWYCPCGSYIATHLLYFLTRVSYDETRG